jgi:hypothetical protein
MNLIYMLYIKMWYIQNIIHLEERRLKHLQQKYKSNKDVKDCVAHLMQSRSYTSMNDKINMYIKCSEEFHQRS